MVGKTWEWPRWMTVVLVVVILAVTLLLIAVVASQPGTFFSPPATRYRTPTPTYPPYATSTNTPTPAVMPVDWDDPCRYANDSSVITRIEGRLGIAAVVFEGTIEHITHASVVLAAPSGSGNHPYLNVRIDVGSGPNELEYLPEGFEEDDVRLHDAQGALVPHPWLVWLAGTMRQRDVKDATEAFACELHVTQIDQHP